jgi:hypothetical protein
MLHIIVGLIARAIMRRAQHPAFIQPASSMRLFCHLFG